MCSWVIICFSILRRIKTLYLQQQQFPLKIHPIAISPPREPTSRVHAEQSIYLIARHTHTQPLLTTPKPPRSHYIPIPLFVRVLLLLLQRETGLAKRSSASSSAARNIGGCWEERVVWRRADGQRGGCNRSRPSATPKTPTLTLGRRWGVDSRMVRSSVSLARVFALFFCYTSIMRVLRFHPRSETSVFHVNSATFVFYM